MVTALHIGQHGFVVVAKAARDILVIAATRTLLGRRRQEDLHVRIGQHHRADIAALDDHTAGPDGQLTLQSNQARPHGRHRRHRRHRLGHRVAADLDRNVFCVKVSAVLAGVVANRQRNVGGRRLNGGGIARSTPARSTASVTIRYMAPVSR